MIIAIDGPAAAGKGTLARHLAEAFDFAHLDTGAIYRATAKKVLDLGLNMDDAHTAGFDAMLTHLLMEEFRELSQEGG